MVTPGTGLIASAYLPRDASASRTGYSINPIATAPAAAADAIPQQRTAIGGPEASESGARVTPHDSLMHGWTWGGWNGRKRQPIFCARYERKKEEFPGFMENMLPGNSFPQICVVSVNESVENVPLKCGQYSTVHRLRKECKTKVTIIIYYISN